MCPAAAFAIRNFANEMVFASTPEIRALERSRLNDSSHSLRSWHERLLFASSTTAYQPGAVQFMSQTAVPTYRATPVIEQVRRFLLVVPPVWAEMLTGLHSASTPPLFNKFPVNFCAKPSIYAEPAAYALMHWHLLWLASRCSLVMDA